MGHERYHSLTPKYYKKELFEKAIPGIIIALCGNKIALDNRQVSKEDGEEYENKVGCIYIEVSAKTNDDIDMFNQIGSRLPMIEEDKPIVLTEDNKEKEKRCYGYCGY